MVYCSNKYKLDLYLSNAKYLINKSSDYFLHVIHKCHPKFFSKHSNNSFGIFSK